MPHHAPIPLVAVAADVKDIDGYRWHAAADQYLRALINGAGVLPLILPSLREIDFDVLLERVDGVLFPGSRTNVHPNAYGEDEDERGAKHRSGNLTEPSWRPSGALAPRDRAPYGPPPREGASRLGARGPVAQR